MKSDHWETYRDFKLSKSDTKAYYDLVRRAFEQGVQRVVKKTRLSLAIDLELKVPC